MAAKTLGELFFEMVSGAIDEEGVYPHQMLSRNSEDRMEVGALAVSGEHAISIAAKKVARGEAEELLLGVDMWTKKGQGTEFTDVIVVLHAKGGVWQIGVIDYQHEPRIVRPLRWDNEFWRERMLRHLDQIGVQRKPATRAE